MTISRPLIAASTASAVFAGAAAGDIYYRIAPGVLIITGFAAYVAFQWWLFTEIRRAVTCAVNTWLASAEVEAALIAWPGPKTVGDGPAAPAGIRHLAPVPSPHPAKHRRAGTPAGVIDGRHGH